MIAERQPYSIRTTSPRFRNEGQITTRLTWRKDISETLISIESIWWCSNQALKHIILITVIYLSRQKKMSSSPPLAHSCETFKLTPSLGLNTNLHIFNVSGSSTLSSILNLNQLSRQQTKIFISVSANFLPTHPLGPCKNVINAFVVYVSGKLSQRSGSNLSAVGPQYMGKRLIELARM